MKFEICDSVLKCFADSGNTYVLTDFSCSCKGFAFRRTCKHFRMAKEKGLLEKLAKQPKPKFRINRNPFIIQSRIKALTEFLKKNGIEPTKKRVMSIEPKLTPEGPTADEVIEMARKIK